MKFSRMIFVVLLMPYVTVAAPLTLFRGTHQSEKVASTKARKAEPRIIESRDAVVFKARALLKKEFRIVVKGKQYVGRVLHRATNTVGSERITTLRGTFFKGTQRQGRFTIAYSGRNGRPVSLFGELVVRGGALYSLQTVEPGKTFFERHKQDKDTPGCGDEDHSRIPPGADTSRRALTHARSGQVQANANPAIITVLVAFSPQAASYLGTSRAASAQTAVDQLTQVFQNSNVNARAELVYITNLTGNESGSFDTDLNNITYVDGKWDEVHALRNQYGADMVALIIQNTQYCGLGWLGGYPGVPLADYSFSASSSYCIVNQTVSHEIGHNIGAHHDRAYASNAAYPDAYGLIFTGTSGRKYGDVMSYAQYSGATRIPYFSNPNINYEGVATGKLGTENNARVVSILAPLAAENRGSPVPPTPSPTPGSYTVSGTFAAGGTGISGARVSLKNGNGDVVAVTTTDTQGRFSFSTVRGSQTYQVSVIAPGYSSSATNVSVDGNTSVPIVATRKTFLLTASVIDGLSSLPIQGATVFLHGLSSGPTAATTSSQGKVSFDIPYGTQYRLNVSSDQYLFRTDTLQGTLTGPTTRVFSAIP